jgi:hypothetical protein
MKLSQEMVRVAIVTITLAVGTSALAAEQRGTPPPPPAAPPPPASPAAPPAPPPPPPPPQNARQASANTRTLRVDVVLSRARDGKTISRVPYSLLVNAGDGINERSSRSSLRVGVDVPTGREQTSKTGDNMTTQSEFRYLGTRIDCSATILQDGVYKVWINLQDSSLVPLDADPRAVNAHRQYSVSNHLTLREGVPLPFSVGTDQLTGETTRAELTVTAVK